MTPGCWDDELLQPTVFVVHLIRHRTARQVEPNGVAFRVFVLFLAAFQPPRVLPGCHRRRRWNTITSVFRRTSEGDSPVGWSPSRRYVLPELMKWNSYSSGTTRRCHRSCAAERVCGVVLVVETDVREVLEEVVLVIETDVREVLEEVVLIETDVRESSKKLFWYSWKVFGESLKKLFWLFSSFRSPVPKCS